MTEIKFVPRVEWHALPPRRRIVDRVPWLRAHLHHTVTGEGESALMRNIQRDHLARGFDDFAYNDGCSQSGVVYEGRGVPIRHANEDRGQSYTIVALGNFQIVEPSDVLLRGIAWRLADLFLSHSLVAGQLTGGHSDLEPTACPGSKLYAKIPQINVYAKQIVDALVNENGDEDMKRMIVRNRETGEVFVFNGETLRPANDPEYQQILRFYGAEVPATNADGHVAGHWFNWTNEQICSVPKVTGMTGNNTQGG